MLQNLCLAGGGARTLTKTLISYLLAMQVLQAQAGSATSAAMKGMWKQAASAEAKKHKQVFASPPLSHTERTTRNVRNAVAAVRSRPAPASLAPAAGSSHALPALAANADVNMADVLADIGTPKPFDVVPSMAALSADYAQLGHVNAASSHGLTMMFNGLLAVNSFVAQRPLRLLVDTGANHSYVSEQFLKGTGVVPKKSANFLSLANGSKAVSAGCCNLDLSIQSFKKNVKCHTLPVSDAFDVILGQDWCERVCADISFDNHTVVVSDSIGKRIKLIPQDTDIDVLCPLVSAVQLEHSLEDGDLLYMVHVTEADQSDASAHTLNHITSDEPTEPVDARLSICLSYLSVYLSVLSAG